MASLGLVAIVGKPNVGKSMLFNRIVGERLSIVEDYSGVTRDRLYAKATWLTKEFRLVDTGGIQLADAPFIDEIRTQAMIAIEEADVIIYVADGKIGATSDDEYVAKILKKSKKPVILAVNKIDNFELNTNIYEFYSLGLGDPIALSVSHGIGIGDLLDKVIEDLPNEAKDEDEDTIRFSLIGRPNVGKSSLVNAILNDNRVIVSDIAGTTRDSVDVSFTNNGQKYEVVDTAGLKKRGKIFENLDKYAALRSMGAIEKSDIVLLVIDAEQGILDQDKNVAGFAYEESKPIIIVVNKWDLVDKDTNSMTKFEDKLKEEFKFLAYANVVFVSALEKKRIHTIFNAITETNDSMNKRVSTSVLNDVISDAQAMNQSPMFNGGRVRIYYASQVAIAPPTFILFVNNTDYMHFSYQRYLENKLRDAFGFEGTPIKILLRKRV
ncbi:ribosome biogenesis GTPase Der [Mycoplasma sp. P36-A1]|uniref:ribosome biogenesis GTPase Der n=1 Tax=Mycoplasma sp. P36-A1 TaxID=3252900 RepID=UPI003C2AD85F